MVKWEYRTLKVKVTHGWKGTKVDQQGLDRLDQAGREGWEAVSAVNLNEGFGATSWVLYTLKRQVA